MEQEQTLTLTGLGLDSGNVYPNKIFSFTAKTPKRTIKTLKLYNFRILPNVN